MLQILIEHGCKFVCTCIYIKVNYIGKYYNKLNINTYNY